ncbi:MFS general substrate transporter [Tilletiaria anomala UBC 951]|uniref:MFS general substrate transporter n=1 Tax=Tilletiaria anomala (strain ATCC 24038 / CBS 436.72 / UBC 951) TaxID=1037660 RepID=A0A066W7B8_TILAU|nr:MFS general substrate transporter [Tilletiaria anomala UBC 951]KDN46979.1 MFS general substrate transporter [Tilletiaria anomala UBC 951]
MCSSDAANLPKRGEEDGRSFSEDPSSSADSDATQLGVVKAEAARRVVGWQLYVAWLGIALVSYVYGLDNNTTYAYLTAAATFFSDYNLYPAMSVVQQVLIGVMKLPVAKLSDVFGRAEAYTLSIAFYVLGFIVIASSQSTAAVFGGVVLQAIGNTGTQIMQQIVIADWVPADWRGFAIGIVSWPYIVNFAIAPLITGQLASFSEPTSQKWRWGAGMFCILLPIVSSPIILTLALSQRTAKRSGLLSRTRASPGAVTLFKEVDVIGLFLIVTGWLLILLPLQLYSRAPQGWSTSYIIAMLVIGGCCLIATAVWEAFFSPRPIIRRTYIFNKNVLLPTLIGFFDFLSFYASWLNAYSWAQITFDFTVKEATYFSNAQSLCLTVFGIVTGIVAIVTKRYKWQMVTGACIRVLGIGLMICYRTQGSSTAQVVVPQILQGLGGGILGVQLQVAAQVNVPHQDVAMVTAFVLLLTEIGGAVGSAVVGAVQNHVLPTKIALYLPQLSIADKTSIVAAPLAAILNYPLGSPVRDGIIHAWSDFMHVCLIIAIVTGAVPIILTVMLSDNKLTRDQNVIGDKARFGHDSEGTHVDESNADSKV